MMTVCILSKRTTSGGPQASAARGAYGSRGDCRCCEREGDMEFAGSESLRRGCWVISFWEEPEVPAEALFVFFALLASLLSVSLVPSSPPLSLFRFLRASIAEEFLWMT
jgi:hypothetical protein